MQIESKTLVNKYLNANITNPITNEDIPPIPQNFYKIHDPSGTLVFSAEESNAVHRKKVFIGILLIFIIMVLFSFQFTIFVGDLVITFGTMNSLLLPFLFIGGISYGFWIGKQIRKQKQCSL